MFIISISFRFAKYNLAILVYSEEMLGSGCNKHTRAAQNTTGDESKMMGLFQNIGMDVLKLWWFSSSDPAEERRKLSAN
jgi:hypothetical protein